MFEGGLKALVIDEGFRGMVTPGRRQAKGMVMDHCTVQPVALQLWGRGVPICQAHETKTLLISSRRQVLAERADPENGSVGCNTSLLQSTIYAGR